jgi:protein-arginine kinase activator protein McsA
MLCELCQVRPATNHVTSIVDDVVTKRDLCNECFSSSPDAAEAQFLAGNARCAFCGARANIGGHSTAFSILEEHPPCFCFRCFEEFNRYTMSALKRLPTGLTQEQQLEAAREVRNQAQQHMEEFVRNSKQRGGEES